MEIDKKFGKYWSSKETTKLDDLAFFLHLIDGTQPGYPMVEQDIFIEFKDNINLFTSYYKKANIILRIDKINKIRNEK